jgi:hypothetical protein
MIHKLFILTLVLATTLFLPNAVLADETEQRTAAVEKIKSEIGKLGTGPDAEIEVRAGGEKLKGYILRTDRDEVLIVQAKSGKVTSVFYPQVKTVKGQNLATGAKIAIGVGIVVGVLVVFALACQAIKPCVNALDQ